MRNVIKELGGTVSLSGQGSITVDGKTVNLYYFHGSRKSPPFFRISVTGTFGAPLVIRHETASDGFFKKLGLNCEAQISDREIDGRLFFECDIPEFARQIFLDSRVKPLILEILKDFQSIEITPKQCAIVRRPSENPDRIGAEAIKKWAAQLLSLAPSVPRAVHNINPRTRSFRTWRALLYGAGYTALVCGIFCFFSASLFFRLTQSAQIWKISLPITFMIFIAAAYIAYRNIKGFSTSARILIQFLFSFFIGTLLLGRFGPALVNGMLDKNPPREYVKVLTHKYKVRGSKNRNTYYAVVGPWRAGGLNWRFSVSRLEYQRIIPGESQYKITTKPGYLGYEWVVSERLQ